MGAKLSLQETLPTSLMLNEPQSSQIPQWNQQVQNRWPTQYDELPNQLQNFPISSLSVMITYKHIPKTILFYSNYLNALG